MLTWVVQQYTASNNKQQDVSTTATSLSVLAYPRQDIPQDTGRANEGVEDQPVEQEDSQGIFITLPH